MLALRETSLRNLWFRKTSMHEISDKETFQNSYVNNCARPLRVYYFRRPFIPFVFFLQDVLRKDTRTYQIGFYAKIFTNRVTILSNKRRITSLQQLVRYGYVILQPALCFSRSQVKRSSTVKTFF